MSFDDYDGGYRLKASSEDFQVIHDYVNEEFKQGDRTTIEKSRVADIAIAVGLTQDKRVSDVQTPHDDFNLSSVDKHNILKPLVTHNHSEAAPEELPDILSSYLRGGLQEIVEEINKTGTFDYAKFLADT